MPSAVTEVLSSIFDNYSDVIEGGSVYASGTSYNGIPGDYTNEEIRATVITATAGTTSQVTVADADILPDKYLDSTIPPIFMLGKSGGARNANVARRIATKNSTTDIFTFTTSFPDDIDSGDEFYFREGFKRLPDNLDIFDKENMKESFDRYFDFSAMPGKKIGWYGDDTNTFETDLILRVRFLKKYRQRNWRNSVLSNMMRLRIILPRPSLRDGTYTQILDAEASEPSIADESPISVIVEDVYRLVYRVNSVYE